MKTPYQIPLINWLAKVTNGPVVQGAGPLNVIRVGSNEDRRNGVPDFDEVSVEFDSGHGRHMDVGDQASRFDETRGCEEIGRGGKSFDGEAQGPISLRMDSRKNRLSSTTETNDAFGIRPRSSLVPAIRVLQQCRRARTVSCATECPQAMPGPPKRWLSLDANSVSFAAHRRSTSHPSVAVQKSASFSPRVRNADF